MTQKTAQRSGKIAFIIFIFVIINIPVIIYLGNLRSIAYSQEYYTGYFRENNIYSRVPDADNITSDMISFLKGRTDELPDVFRKREKEHLFDVRRIIRGAMIYNYLSVLIAVAVLLSLLHSRNYRRVCQVFFYGGLLALGASFALFLLSLNFDWLFALFHRGFFAPGTWIFSDTDYLIMMFPYSFFMESFAVIVKNSAIAAFIAVIGAKLLSCGRK